MKYPSHDWVDIISEAITPIHHVPIPIRTQAKKSGNTYGKRTFELNFIHRIQKDPETFCRIFGNFMSPWYVLLKIGKKHPRKTMKQAEAFQVQNRMIANGTHAIGGMGRAHSIANNNAPLNRLKPYAKKAADIQTRTPTETPTETRARLALAWK